MKKFRVGVIGATGMVGQRFITLLLDHPWFEVAEVAASSRSAGKTYLEAVYGRWRMERNIPRETSEMVVRDACDVAQVAENVDFIFSALDMDKSATRELEDAYAKQETPVVSNTSAHRWTQDVPVIIPEVNPFHTDIISVQRERLGTTRGFIAAKPNCSLQSYVPPITALLEYKPEKIFVSTYQAVSGAGKTLETWPEMEDNVIPYISGEEEKSEREPLKIWGKVTPHGIENNKEITISAQCARVPVSDGHMATVSILFNRARAPNEKEIIAIWKNFAAYPQNSRLPSAPIPFLEYCDEDERPQTKLDLTRGNGMGISIGRLRRDPIFHYKFVALSHNTIRGAAGGAILLAELLSAQGYITYK